MYQLHVCQGTLLFHSYASMPAVELLFMSLLHTDSNLDIEVPTKTSRLSETRMQTTVTKDEKNVLYDVIRREMIMMQHERKN